MNYEVLHIFSQGFCTIFTNLIILMFFHTVYRPLYKKKLLYVGAFVLWTIIMFGINSFNFAPLNLMYLLISSEIICLKLYNTNFIKSLPYNVLINFFVVFSDTSTYFIWSILFGKNFDEITLNNQLLIISNLLNVLVLYVIVRLFSTIIEKSVLPEIKFQESAFLFLMAVFECYIVYIFAVRIGDSIEGIIIISILLGFLIFNLYITYIIRKVANLYKYKYDMDFLIKQNEMQLAHYKDIDCKYQETRKIIHDMKKHLDVISGLNNLEVGKSLEYGQTLEKRLDSLFGEFQCSNTILSIVINQKRSLAIEKGISVNTVVDDLELSFIEDLDITGIFSNLWDNAIEASAVLVEQERKIDFVMRGVEDYIIVNMENNCCNDLKPVMESDGFLSTKENHMGIGLMVVKSLVEKYDGFFNIDCERNRFIVEITLPIPVKYSNF